MDNKKTTFTTGEIAKMCNISVRTVQFYDKKGIVKPSESSEGGRRIYTEKDLDKFRTVCLYKNLGFSLSEIKDINDADKAECILSELLQDQQERITEQIEQLSEMKEKVHVLQQEIKQNGVITVFNENELNRLLIKKHEHRKTDIMTYIFLGCYVLLAIAGFALTIQMGAPYTYVMLFVAIVLLLGLIYYHSSVNAYVCPHCGKKFVIGFLYDMFSMNGGRKGKYIKCPHCGKRGWMKESYLDE